MVVEVSYVTAHARALDLLTSGVVLWQTYLLRARGGDADGVCEILKLLVSFSTVWLAIFLFLYHRHKFEQLKLTNVLLHQETFVSSGMLWSTQTWNFVAEATVCLVSSRGWAFITILRVEVSASFLHQSVHLPMHSFQVHAPPFVNLEVEMPYYDISLWKSASTVLYTDEIAATFMIVARTMLLVRQPHNHLAAGHLLLS